MKADQREQKKMERARRGEDRILRSGGARICVVVFLLAAVVRGVYLYESSDNPTFRAPIVDSLSYDRLACEAAKGGGIGSEFFWQQFFYPFYLSIVYFLSNCSVVWARLFQGFLGCFSCVLIYRLGEKVFGRPAGIAAGCIAAFYGPMIFFEAELLSAGWAAFWAVVLILLFLKSAKSGGLVVCFVLGLCSALSVVTRPNFIPFLAASGLWLVIVWLRGRVKGGRIALMVLSAAAGFAAVSMPIAAENYRVTGHFSFLPGTGGINLYIGNNPEFEATSIRPGRKWEKIVTLPEEQGLKGRDECERFFYGETIDYIKSQPIRFLRGLVWKGVEFVSSREMPGNIDIYLFRKWSSVLGLLVWKAGGFGFGFGLLLPLAVLGLFLCRRAAALPIVLFIIFYSGSVVLTHVEARYRVPVAAVMCVLAGAAVVRIVEMVSMRRWREVTVAGFAVVILAGLCSAAGPFYSERYVDYEAELYFGLGHSLEKRGRIEEAIEAYSKAIELNGSYVEAHHNLGSLWLKEGEAEKAVLHYEAAISVDAENAVLYDDLGKGLLELGKVEEAIGHYERAIEIKEDFAEAHSNLGIALRVKGYFDEAIRHYQRAIEIQPDYVKAYNNLGIALYLKGDADDAIGIFREALRIEPDFAEGYCNLGSALQLIGEIDEAIAEYRKALKINPDYTKARELLKKALAKQQNH